MNAEKAKLLGLTNDVTKFKPNTWVRVYWGNGDRDHQYSSFLTEQRIKYLTEWPARGQYYRTATPAEIKAGELRGAMDLIDQSLDEFRLKERHDDAKLAEAFNILKRNLDGHTGD